jgi:hypothetical protein
MKNTFLWLAAVIGVLLWSAYEMYPPTARSLLTQFELDAENTQDGVLPGILGKAREWEGKPGSNTINNLLAAAGTNSLERYFPRMDVPTGKETNRFILNQLQRRSLGQIKLGLDLQGGMQFVVRMQTNEFKDPAALERALDQAVEILRRRVDSLGVAEPTLQKSGSDRIEIQMPGLTDSEKDEARRRIEKAAFLQFRMVHDESESLLQQGLVPFGYEVLTEVRKDPKTGASRTIPMLVKKKPEQDLTGKYITRASAVPDPMTGEPKIEFELIPRGRRFSRTSRAYSPRGRSRGHSVFVPGHRSGRCVCIRLRAFSTRSPEVGASSRAISTTGGLRAGERADEPARGAGEDRGRVGGRGDAGSRFDRQRRTGHRDRYGVGGRSSCWPTTCSRRSWPMPPCC